jgi:hypothetical protein
MVPNQADPSRTSESLVPKLTFLAFIAATGHRQLSPHSLSSASMSRVILGTQVLIQFLQHRAESREPRHGDTGFSGLAQRFQKQAL